MNILVPDKWLRDYLKTDATSHQLKEYLSLCGPSVERINTVQGEIVYDIEVTGNRPDVMSIMGVAREAAAILPRFGIHARLQGDPYTTATTKKIPGSKKLPLTITTDETVNPRWTSIVLNHVVIKPSPPWLAKRLEQIGIHPINNVVDITNYVMHAYGQPAHVFDYDTITDHTMILRESKKGETITTLDGKTHTLTGGDIVIEDGSGTLIDLCGIMGGANSSITKKTTRVVLFLQTYEQSHIRKTSMNLAHRTQAAGLFEKGLDPELVLPVFYESMSLMHKLTQATVASSLTDIYPHPYHPKEIRVNRNNVDTYIATHLEDKEITHILTSLGCTTSVTKQTITVTPPSYRNDLKTDVDIIEELSRMYGYANIKGKLPETEPPMTFEDPILSFEHTIKETLCHWGYTETYTYSMISEELMDLFSLNKETTYTITNPLSSDWVYMRPTLLPSMLLAMKQNISYEPDLKLFELSTTYAWNNQDLPDEQSTLIVAVSGQRYLKMKGIAERLFSMFGIAFPNTIDPANSNYQKDRSLRLGTIGQLGEIDENILRSIGITKPITVLEVSVQQLLKHRSQTKQYHPIPKNPASFEDMAFVVPDKTYTGPLIRAISNIDPIIKNVTLFDSYKNIRTFHITYQSDSKNLTKEDTGRIREKIIAYMKRTAHATLKN